MNARIATLLTLTTALFALLPAVALAAAPEAKGGPNDGMFALGLGLCMGLAVIGGGLGQGKAASAALEGICRNPGASGRVLVPLLLSLSFIESLVLFALMISFSISGRFGI